MMTSEAVKPNSLEAIMFMNLEPNSLEAILFMNLGAPVTAWEKTIV
jgi:hypothetical protein